MLQPGTSLVFMFTYQKKKSTIIHPSHQFPPTVKKICSLLGSVSKKTPSPCLSSLFKAVLLVFYLQPRPTPQPWCQDLQDTSSQPFCAFTFSFSCCLYSPKDLLLNLSKIDIPLADSQRKGTTRHCSSSQNEAIGCCFSSFSFLSKAGLTAVQMAAHKSQQGFT